MIAFQSARRALGCAVALQRAFDARNGVPSEETVRVRIGLHTGEAIREADDFFGKNVILAARIAKEARGGEILVSSLLKELIESGGDVRFGKRRDVALECGATTAGSRNTRRTAGCSLDRRDHRPSRPSTRH
jgi:class 3 adenylate cyclase